MLLLTSGLMFAPGAPELAAVAVVLARRAVPYGVGTVMRVPVGDVEAEAFLTPPLLRHQSLSVVVGDAVFLLQGAQRQNSVDWLEDNGADHLQARDGAFRNCPH